MTDKGGPRDNKEGESSMVELKVVVSDPKTVRAYNVDASTGAAGAIVGKKIGDEVDAGPSGLQAIRS